ncbi:hypothetical protein BDZ89DRAFT_280318 [Hymenopellis radicata]|nr:hypothetical protein BDZ89DRAFT_280318 [Hymenopellis radicata]
MLVPSTPLVLNPKDTSTPAADVLSAAKPTARKKNVMYINGEEVDLDEHDHSPVEPKKPLMIACSFRAKRNTPTSSPPPIPTPPVVVPA